MQSRKCFVWIVAATLLAPWAGARGQTPLTTAFTYQGYLSEQQQPADGDYDFQFTLYDAETGGNVIAGPVDANDVPVADGLFTVELDCGAGAFKGDDRWLEVAVRPGTSTGAYTTLSPRQAVTPAPYSIYSQTAGTVAGGITGSGTGNRIARFTGSSAVGDSEVYQNSHGRIGIRGAPYWGGVVPGWGPDLHINTGSEPATVWLGKNLSTNGADIGSIQFVGSAGGVIGPAAYAGITGKIVNSGTTGGQGALLFHTARGGIPSWYERMRITHQGRVGIGTSSPAQLLDVDGTAQVQGFKMPTGAAGGRVLTSDASGAGTWQALPSSIGGSGTAGYVPKFTAGKTIGNSLIKSTSSYVGVGTTNPAFRFHVRGVQGAGTDAILYLEADWNPEIYFDKGGPNADTKLHFTTGGYDEFTLIHDGSENELNFNRAGVGTILNITGGYGGRVGIKTASPKGTLDVNGSIYQRGGQLHADYVFEPGYELESIEDHARFMWSEKHLPAVAAARQDEEGREIVELGARQRGTLEELEKAHIYIEQLHKRLRALESEMKNSPTASGRDARITALKEHNEQVAARLAAVEALLAQSAQAGTGGAR